MGLPAELCPRCGGTPIATESLSDRLQKIDLNPPSIGGGGIAIRSNPSQDIQFRCHGCNIKYVHADLDRVSLKKHLRYRLKIYKKLIDQIFYYYEGKTTLEDLLENHITAIIRNPNHAFSFITNKINPSPLFICFNFNNKRTVATLIKTHDNDGEYYTITRIAMP